MKAHFFIAVLFATLFALSSVASATSYALTVQTNSGAYVGTATITVFGQVEPAPGPSTSVLLRVYNPNMTLATVADAPVNGTTGSYTTSFVAGGSTAWVDGTYTVNATWGAYGPVIFETATFTWASTSSTTTTSTSSTTSTLPPSSTISTSTFISPTSITSSSTPTSSIVPTTTSSATSTSSASSSTGNVPEFPYQILAMVLFSALVLTSYLVIRSRRAGTTGPVQLRKGP